MGKAPRTKLVFVYNADSGLFNTLTDIAHKTFAPESYSCDLCAITYGTFGMRSEWKLFLESLEQKLEFLHRDELFEQYGIVSVALPAIFMNTHGSLEILITASEISSCSSISELKRLIVAALGHESVIP